VLQRGLYSYRGSIRAARHVVGFNAILLTLSCAAFIVGAAFYHQRVSFVGLDVESEFLTMYGTLTAPYALLSFVQGAVMIAVVHNYRALFPADGLGEDAPDKAEACIPFVSTFASLRRKRTWQVELPLP